eukprot:gene13717-15147_t
MSKRKQWDNCLNKMKAKRLGKKAGDHQEELLTVQQLSASVEGKAQKYTRIGPLTMIKNWKLLHIRFIKAGEGGRPTSGSSAVSKTTRNKSYRHSREIQPYEMEDEVHINDRRSPSIPIGGSEYRVPESTVFAKTVPLSQLINLGKLIPPNNKIVAIELEAFNVNLKSWQDPFGVQLSVSLEKFASGGSRDAYLAKGIKGIEGRFVVKRYRPDCIEEIERLFKSTEDHTRKTVQMHALA